MLNFKEFLLKGHVTQRKKCLKDFLTFQRYLPLFVFIYTNKTRKTIILFQKVNNNVWNATLIKNRYTCKQM